MSWPLSHEFNEAVQNPQVVFSDPDLKGGETVVGATGLPLPRSGNFADVYQVRGADGREWAVKCFTRPVAGLAERYAKLSAALAKAELPFAVGFAYLAEGIRVGGMWRPIVKMEWVEGLLLNQVARENAGKPKVLAALGQMWSKLCKRLREAGVAHADIQHGNVLLVPGSRSGAYGLKLIDYDGMWVPALANTPSGESGHPSYQHPARAATRTYSPDVDRFPHLAVATALQGLSVGGPALWEKYDNGDNVLFTEADYKKPADSKLMKELWHTGEPGVQALVGRLAIACGKPVPQTPWLDHLAPEGDPAPLDDTTRREAAAALGISLPVPVALPPEPSALPLPTEPAFTIDPEPLPAALELPPPPRAYVPPAPVAAPPLQPVVVFDADEVEVELIEDRRPPKRKPKKRQKTSAGSPNTRVLLFAGGGLLLLVGGVIAGVLIAGGGKQKPGTVQQKADEPKDTGTKGQGEGAKPKDKGPVTPPVTPPATPPVSPPAPGAADRFDPRQAWLFPLADTASPDAPLAGRDSRTALIQLGNRGEVLILDLETGKPLPSPDDHFDRNMVALALDGGRFSAGRLVGRPGVPQPQISVWDPRQAKYVQHLSARDLMVPSMVYVSPTGKYLAATTNGQADGDTFKLKSTDPEKVILNVPWTRGSAFFTDDESRVLLAEATGECRWYKLPSGELDREWKIEKKGPDLTPQYRIMSASGDGSVLAFYGTVGERQRAIHVLDGATGKVLFSTHALGALFQPPTLSRDGRFMLFHDVRPGQPDRAVVFDVVTHAEVCNFGPPEGFFTFRPVLLPDGRGAVAVIADKGRRAVVLYDFGRPGEVAVVKPPEPAVPPPIPVPAAPGEPLALKERWSAPLGDQYYAHKHASEGSSLVLAVPAQNGRPLVLDLTTGAPRAGFAGLGATSDLVPLDGGRVASRKSAGGEFLIWDEKTGKEVGKLPVPEIPPGAEKGTWARAFPSPNGKHLVVGWTGIPRATGPDQPLHIFNTANPKKAVTATEWKGGSVHFTADSSRALVAEWTGRCRWFELATGKLGGEWQLAGDTTTGRYHTVSGISADGSVVGYCGPDGHPPNWAGASVLDGATGKAIYRFPSKEYDYRSGIAVSADGRRVAVQRSMVNKDTTSTRIDVADSRTGAVLGRAMVGYCIPSCILSRNGSTLVVFTGQAKKVHMFDVPAGGAVAVKPPDPEPGAPPKAGELTLRWSVPLKGSPRGGAHFDRDGRTVSLVYGGLPWSIDALSVQDGKPVRDLPNLKGNSAYPMPLDKGKFAYWADHAREIVVWDTATDKTTSRPYPQAGGNRPFVSVAPNGRYAVVGAAAEPAREVPENPFAVIDLTTGKELFSKTWRSGSALFTADSSRVLTVDDAGSFRWFKLPRGEADGSWSFDLKSNGFNARNVSVSGDGSLVLYEGSIPGKELTYHLLNGKTGEIIHSLPPKRYVYHGSVSDDGQFVALIRNDGFGTGHSVEVVNQRGEVVASVRIPGAGGRPGGVYISLGWKGSSVVVAGRDAEKLSVYDLGVPAPK
jgi:WD40 repeat protein